MWQLNFHITGNWLLTYSELPFFLREAEPLTATLNTRALILFKWKLGTAAGKGELQRSELEGRQGAGEEGSKFSLALSKCCPDSLARRRKPGWESLRLLKGSCQELSSSNVMTCSPLTILCLNISSNHFRPIRAPVWSFSAPKAWQLSDICWTSRISSF